MKNIVAAIFAAVIGLGAMVQDVEAKRLGGGQSSGVSRDSSVMKREAAPAKPAAPAQAGAAAATPPQSGMSRWLGPLAGLAAGIGLAAMLSHFGLGEGMANILMILAIVGIAVFAIRWLMRKRQSAGGMRPAMQPAMQYAGAPARFEPTRLQDAMLPTAAAGSVAAMNTVAHVPADFDVEGFVRQAKLNFIRLQAANDRGDMDDIRQFCTPELFAEIQMQFQERGRGVQQTDVMELNAELLDVENQAVGMMASVRFSGSIREEANMPPESFVEVWHLSRPADGSLGWCIAGIQQQS
ncbi:MAG TPA: Tim44-like domain-containing protein [Rhodocyclaceae bacterium]|nr:Tim44-like domain-containing protein [Rhodocyclaceae bacterium]